MRAQSSPVRTITGKIAGKDSNAVVVDSLKAGSDGITFTSGSLWIDGVIVKEGTTENVTIKIVSGTEVYISGQLDEGATMEIDAGATVTIEKGATFASNGTITNAGTIVNQGTLTNNTSSSITNAGSIENKSTIVNEGTIENKSTIVNTGIIDNSASTGTVTNDKSATIKMIESSEVSGSIVNNGILADERESGSTAVAIDETSEGVVVTEKNADAYNDSGTTVIVEDAETTSGTVSTNSNKYVFVDEITTTGNLNIVLNEDYKQYTITVPSGTTIGAATTITVSWKSTGTNTVTYDIDTDGILKFTASLPSLTGFASAKVYYDDYKLDNVKYNSSTGIVTFVAEHNSEFRIVLSETPEPVNPDTSGSDNIDQNVLFIGVIVLLLISIFSLVAIIKRK